ncbi:hypothetical protein BRAS3843_570058 [Bradyrhizobium sp. STM 3843]|nr:hypothetical protein BRAS3843_570058 [Bradyrhizobium sp. STM 3843]
MARCDTPSATARCFSSARNWAKLWPLWQAAVRAGGVRTGRGATVPSGAGANCADAADPKAIQVAMMVNVVRRLQKRLRIHSHPAAVNPCETRNIRPAGKGKGEGGE